MRWLQCCKQLRTSSATKELRLFGSGIFRSWQLHLSKKLISKQNKVINRAFNRLTLQKNTSWLICGSLRSVQNIQSSRGWQAFYIVSHSHPFPIIPCHLFFINSIAASLSTSDAVAGLYCGACASPECTQTASLDSSSSAQRRQRIKRKIN